jgi:predicted metal-binding protein
MARIGIITCSNCTQDTNCASVVCLADMRKRKGLFEQYAKEDTLELIGILSCAGCPTLAAPEKIMKRVDALAAFKVDALHFSYCMTALCPFIEKYAKLIREKYPDLQVVMGTHKPIDKNEFRRAVKELLCPTITVPQAMGDIVKGTLKLPGGPLKF